MCLIQSSVSFAFFSPGIEHHHARSQAWGNLCCKGKNIKVAGQQFEMTTLVQCVILWNTGIDLSHPGAVCDIVDYRYWLMSSRCSVWYCGIQVLTCLIQVQCVILWTTGIDLSHPGAVCDIVGYRYWLWLDCQLTHLIQVQCGLKNAVILLFWKPKIPEQQAAQLMGNVNVYTV